MSLTSAADVSRETWADSRSPAACMRDVGDGSARRSLQMGRHRVHVNAVCPPTRKVDAVHRARSGTWPPLRCVMAASVYVPSRCPRRPDHLRTMSNSKPTIGIVGRVALSSLPPLPYASECAAILIGHQRVGTTISRTTISRNSGQGRGGRTGWGSSRSATASPRRPHFRAQLIRRSQSSAECSGELHVESAAAHQQSPATRSSLQLGALFPRTRQLRRDPAITSR